LSLLRRRVNSRDKIRYPIPFEAAMGSQELDQADLEASEEESVSNDPIDPKHRQSFVRQSASQVP